jgi:multisubunit Na+/H+ antiporter MnhE subunit
VRSLLSRGFWAAVVVGGALYLLLIDNTSSPELYAMAAAVLLAAVFTEAAGRRGLRGASAHPRRLRHAWRVLAQVPRDIFWVSAAALSQLVSPQATRGSLRAVPFDFGDADDPGDMARRALTEGLGSLTPNTIVLGIDEERNLLLVHQLRRSGPTDSVDLLKLGTAGTAERRPM